MRKYKTIEVNDYEEMLNEISNSNEIDFDNFDLLIYGGGGQEKKFYSELKTSPKYKVLWSGWPGPKWTKFLSFIPGQSGLVKILEQGAFYELYYELATLSVSDVIYVKKTLTNSITEQVKKYTWKVNFEKILENEPNSFVLTSETDQTIKENGKEKFLYDFTLGSELNEKLKNIINRKNKNDTQHSI